MTNVYFDSHGGDDVPYSEEEDNLEEVEFTDPVRKKLSLKAVTRAVTHFLGVPDERAPDQYEPTNLKVKMVNVV